MRYVAGTDSRQMTLGIWSIEDEVAQDNPARFIEVFVDSLGDSSVVLGIRGCVETSDYWQTRWDLLERIKLSFDEAGIEIPYNKMDVHLKQ